jgi:hypothetical protein
MTTKTTRGSKEDKTINVGEDDDAEGMARFLRGMTLGALVGAAIAGSAIWQRARSRTSETPETDRTAEAGDTP